MKLISLSTAFLMVFLNACIQSGGSDRTVAREGLLSAVDFSEALQQAGDATILDVRTPSEFAGGHISGAVNLDISAGDFEKRVKELDRTKPVFVYCLSGGRSATAAPFLRGQGFRTVHDLQGGIMQWRTARLPLEQAVKSEKIVGMTPEEYEALLSSEKLVLVDFYADWCQPCKRMEPYLVEIIKEQSDKVKVVRIDVDANRLVSEHAGISVLPTLLLYKGGEVSWQHEGYIEKEEVLKQLAGF